MEETNRRFKYLLSQGQTGLSVAFDMPTLMGYDADHPISSGEVGVCGVAISSLKDMEILFDGIDLSQISISMTINGPAVILFAFYIAVAEKQGADISTLNGTLQNDIFSLGLRMKISISFNKIPSPLHSNHYIANQFFRGAPLHFCPKSYCVRDGWVCDEKSDV